MYQVRCPHCSNLREVNAKKPWMQGEPPYEQICKSCCQIGKIKTDEHKRKLSESVKALQTTEVREKKRRDRLARPDLIANLIPGQGVKEGIEAWTGSHHSEEGKKTISEALSGKEVTEETKQKMSQSAKKRGNKDES